MNCGLCESKQNFVLFVDDDIIPEPGLLEHHVHALEQSGAALVAGRVIQPWHERKEGRWLSFRLDASGVDT